MNRLDVISKINYLEDTLKDTKGNVYVKKRDVTRIISQAKKPKVTIPNFMADWIDYCKGKGISCRGSMSVSVTPKKINEWLSETEGVATNEEVFFNAWFYGYEVEEEKLYHVQLTGVRCGDLGYQEEEGHYDFFNKRYTTRTRYELTEAEIKDNFPWAWGYAREVQ